MSTTAVLGQLSRLGGAPLIFARTAPSGAANRLTGIFCSGFLSTMNGEKALRCERFFASKGHGFVRFDYTGVGASAANATAAVEVRFKQWKTDVLQIIDDVAREPVLLIGSSMGSWLSLLAALERPELVRGIVLIAPAIDFIRRWVSSLLSATPALASAFEKGDNVTLTGPYGDMILNKTLIEDVRPLELFVRFPESQKIPVRCPVRILHGQKDESCPWRDTLTLAERLESANVDVIFRKAAEHRFSQPEDLLLLEQTVENLLHSINSPPLASI